MIRKYWFVVFISGLLAAGSGAFAQQRGNSGIPDGPGNPLASLQQQIDALTQQLTSLTNGAVQGGAESLAVIRGTIAGNPAAVMQGAGFSVSASAVLPCGVNMYPEYTITFDQPFSAPPSVVVSARDTLSAPFGSNSNAPVFTAAIVNNQNGGVTINGFTVRIKTDAFGFSTTCFGSYPWDFIAVGPR